MLEQGKVLKYTNLFIRKKVFLCHRCVGLLHARAEDGCEVEDGDEKEDGDGGSDSGSLTVRSAMHKIKRYKTTMRREIPQLCHHTGGLLVTRVSSFKSKKNNQKVKLHQWIICYNSNRCKETIFSAQRMWSQAATRCLIAITCCYTGGCRSTDSHHAESTHSPSHGDGLELTPAAL